MNELKVINEQEVLGKNFRIYGDFENPLFLAKDVAEWIDYSKRSDGSYLVTAMISHVDEDEKIKIHTTVNNLNGGLDTWFLTENGLYEVLFLSGKPIAKEFKKEVKKILHQLRAKGGYITECFDEKQEIQKHHNLKSRNIDTVSTEAEENKTMTTKEVAEQLGTKPNVITENAKKCLPNKKIENGKPTYWTQAEVTVLLEHMKSNNANQHNLSRSLIGVSTELTPALKLKKALELAQEAYEEELARIRAENQKITVERDNLKIELDESKEWTTLQKYFNSKGWETDRSKLSQLSKILGNLGYERKKIYSVEYERGLWSYRIKDLDEYFLEPEF